MSELKLSETFTRGPDNQLVYKDPNKSHSNKSITILDVFSHACSAKPSDDDYALKIQIATKIGNDYQEYTNSNKDQILQIIQVMSSIKDTDITDDELIMFKLLLEDLKKKDQEDGNYMSNLLTKNPDSFKKFVQVIKESQNSTNVKLSKDDKLRKVKDVKPWKGGKQKGGVVGIFESLKSVFSLDEYWKKPWDSSSIYTFFYENYLDKMLSILTTIKNTKDIPDMDDMLTHNREPSYLQQHNEPDFLRDIIRLIYYTCKGIFLGIYSVAYLPAHYGFKLIKGTTMATIGIAYWTPVVALSLLELAIKPALLAVDLTVSSIALLFRTAGLVAVADGDGGVPAGGSKKTRHHKKNTKKNKKRKQRNTNRR